MTDDELEKMARNLIMKCLKSCEGTDYLEAYALLEISFAEALRTVRDSVESPVYHLGNFQSFYFEFHKVEGRYPDADDWHAWFSRRQKINGPFSSQISSCPKP